MATKTSKKRPAKRSADPLKDKRPWSALTQEERVVRVNAVRGMFAGLLSTEEFMRNKQEEIDLEEEKFQWRRHKQ